MKYDKSDKIASIINDMKTEAYYTAIKEIMSWSQKKDTFSKEEIFAFLDTMRTFSYSDQKDLH